MVVDGGIAAFEFRPLYRQVRDKLIRRLADGVWSPGEPLPSEMQLAAELGVSQGTVRKALDVMASENLVVRRQGKGTFVAKHDEERIMFRFFKLVPDSGIPSFPKSNVLSIGMHRASAAERGALSLGNSDKVIRVVRLRSIDNRPAIFETVIVPESLFPGIEEMELPNNLYGLYSMRFGVTVARSEEKLKAVAATEAEAKALGTSVDHPLLRIERIAFSVEKTPVEWRLSACLTDRMHYVSDLR